MKITTTNSNQACDVLVMFPSAKNFPVEDKEVKKQDSSPLSELIEEVGAHSRPKAKKVMSLPSTEAIKSIRTTRDYTDALEIRLKSLEDIQHRLAFYLEDITNANKKF